MKDASTNLAVGLEVARALGHARLESVVLCNIGIVQKALGRAARAARCCSGRPGRGREPALREKSDRASLGIVLRFQAEAAHRTGLLEVAHEKLRGATSMALEQNAPASSGFGTALDRVRDLLKLVSPA